MKFFGGKSTENKSEKSETVPIEKQIAETILNQKDRLGTLFSVFDNLPSDLVEWFIGLLNVQSSSKNYVEVDIAQTIVSDTIIPGDIIVRRNRDPKPDDLINMGIRYNDGTYDTTYAKVMRVNFRDSTVFVQDLFGNEGAININNVISVVDVVKFNSDKWKTIADLLNIDYDKREIINRIKESIDSITRTENFHNKDDNLKLLNDRLKVLEK